MDQNEALQRLRAIAKKRTEKGERERAAKANQRRKEEDKARADREAYARWVADNRPRAVTAARTIWSWYEEFVASEFFAEFKATHHGRSLDLSEEHNCREPRPNWPKGYPYDQYLGVCASGVLYVHNCVKYGKSYPIEEEANLLELVAWKILIIVAGTIESDTIWDFVFQSVE